MRKIFVCLQVAAVFCIGVLPGTSFGQTFEMGGQIPSGTSVGGMANPTGSVVVQSMDSTLGPYLTDAQGKSLYMFEADPSGMSNCYEQCAQAWPPLLASQGQSIQVAGNTDPNLIGTITRADGLQQVTYNGMPLYHFVRDTQQGDITGQGFLDFGAPWYLVSPSGTQIR